MWQTPSPQKANKFKVGDKVRVNDEAPDYQGRIGTVTNTYQLAEADSQRYRYVVFFIEDGADAVFYDFELEMAS